MRAEWNALGGDRNPFLRHEFFAALEHTGCIGRETGWDPCYFTLKDSKGLAAAVAAFRKTHSYGEFVFDFAWAQAYSRFGAALLPQADSRGAVHAGHRTAPPGAAGPGQRRPGAPVAD